MSFEIINPIDNIEIIAKGRGIRELSRLNKQHGKGRWRKLKGSATVILTNGDAKLVELHWYEANGVERREFKIKRFLE